jgi:hypothetical protein
LQTVGEHVSCIRKSRRCLGLGQINDDRGNDPPNRNAISIGCWWVGGYQWDRANTLEIPHDKLPHVETHLLLEIGRCRLQCAVGNLPIDRGGSLRGIGVDVIAVVVAISIALCSDRGDNKQNEGKEREKPFHKRFLIGWQKLRRMQDSDIEGAWTVILHYYLTDRYDFCTKCNMFLHGFVLLFYVKRMHFALPLALRDLIDICFSAVRAVYGINLQQQYIF